MSLSKLEAAILEATSNYLKQPGLGLKENPKGDPVKEFSGHQYQWSNIGLYFRAKLNESECRHIDSISAAFAQAHSYMFIDNPKFAQSFDQNMRSGQYSIPTVERKKAMEILESVVKEMTVDEPGEKDAGWNQHLDEIVELTSHADTRKAKMTEPFSGGGPAPKDGKRDSGVGVANVKSS